MKKPHFEIDFNRIYPTALPPGDDLLHLSYLEKPIDKNAQQAELHDGMAIYVYVEDVDEEGNPCVMIAPAIAIRNPNEFELTKNRSVDVKWMCRLTSCVDFISFEEHNSLV